MTPTEVQNRIESLELAVNVLLQELAIIREKLKNVRRGDD